MEIFHGHPRMPTPCQIILQELADLARSVAFSKNDTDVDGRTCLTSLAPVRGKTCHKHVGRRIVQLAKLPVTLTAEESTTKRLSLFSSSWKSISRFLLPSTFGASTLLN